MIAVITAGGKGTRISSIANDIPKPMIKIGGKPVLEHQIECLREQGFKEIIITVGHLGNCIIDYFGNGDKVSPITKQPFGVYIQYYIEEIPLGNAGALFKIKEKITGDFLLLNADSIFDIDFKRFVKAHIKYGGLVTLFTHPNDHPYDSALIITDEYNAVQKWLTKEDVRPQYYKNRVNAGLHIISPEVLETNITTDIVDLDRQILKPLAGSKKMFVYDSPEYVKDMGTPERYRSVCQDYLEGKIHIRNLKNKQKAVFLDRDGTINKHIGFLRELDEFEFLPGVAKAIRKINQLSYLAILVTNQPVIARGEITKEQLQRIHNKMETLLGQEGAYLDAIYYCPHHPHKGYAGEITELKYQCACRKPKPGMLLKAAEDFNLDLKKSWIVGDSINDINAGIAAGCKSVLLDYTGLFFEQCKTAKNLQGFVDRYLAKDNQKKRSYS